MAGIQDVQPKAIQQVNLPVIAPAVMPGPAGSGVSESLPQAFDAYTHMFNQFKDKPLIQAQRENAMQQAQLTQQNAPGLAAAQAAQNAYIAAKSKQDQATMTTKDLEQAYINFHGHAILSKDGSVNHVATSQAGAQLNNLQSYATYLRDSLTPNPPIKYWDNGVEHSVFRGKYNADLTPNPDGSMGKEEMELRGHLNDVIHAIYTDSSGPPNTPGSMAQKPGPDDPAPVVDPAGFPDGSSPRFDRYGNRINQPAATAPAPLPVVDPTSSQAISPGIPLTPADVVSSVPLPATPPSVTPVVPQDLVQGVRSSLGLPANTYTPAPAAFSPSAAQDAYAAWNAQQAANVPQPTEPVAQPTQPASVTVEPHPSGGSKITVQPATVDPSAPPPPPPPPPTGNRSMITGYAPGFSPPEIVKSLRESRLYQNWAEKSGPVGRFKAAASSYTGAPGEITTQKDLALANAALQLQSSGEGGSGRGNPEMRVKSLEEAQPLLEQAYGFKAKILKTRLFEDGTRNRLIALGRQSVQALEDPARGAVQTASDQLQRSQALPEQHLYPYELGLLKGGGATAAPGGGSGAFGPTVKTLDGRNVRMKLPVAGGQ